MKKKFYAIYNNKDDIITTFDNYKDLKKFFKIEISANIAMFKKQHKKECINNLIYKNNYIKIYQYER